MQSIDSGVLFPADRTYLFVGMAGELGQLLAEWMVAHGARYVVLTNPKIRRCHEDALQRRDQKHVSRCHVAESLSSVHVAITKTLPPITSVINGPMVLLDKLFANMTFEQFACVAEPKVLGTRLLDELFHDDGSRELFIVASSISSVINWGGQTKHSCQ